MITDLQEVRRTRVHHGYEPRGSQLDLFNCNFDQIVLSGPAGTGKSRACLEKMHVFAKMYPGFKGMIIRKNQEWLTNTALATFKQYVAAADLKLQKVIPFGGSKFRAPGFEYENGSVINMGGMKDERQAQKVMSSEYDMIYVQEATELEEGDWENLVTRNRNWCPGIPMQQIIADCNPSTPTHWLKIRCDQGRTLMLNTKHEENPMLFDDAGRVTMEGADYIAKLDGLSGVRYQRLRLGRWVAAEGIIFEDFDQAVHVIDPFPIPDDWARYWSVDFGYVNPFVWQNWAESPDGILYLTQEIYRTQTLVEDHAKEILYQASGQKRPQIIITDHDAEDRETLERHIGWSTRAAKKEVLPGIEACQSRLRQRRVFFFRGALTSRDHALSDAKKPTCTAEEIPGYIWHEHKTPAGITVRKEGPVKENDHGCDGFRYVVAERDLRGSPGVRWIG